MKCAIFLLTLCAFKTVFAEIPFEWELYNIHESTTIGMKDIMASFYMYCMNTIPIAQRKNAHATECWREYYLMEGFHQARIMKCNECYFKALASRRKEEAKQCYRFNILALEKVGNSHRNALDVCLKNIWNPHFTRPTSSHQSKRE